MALGFPVLTKQFSIALNAADGEQTCAAVASLYADRIVFIVTQLPTLGTIVHAHKETVLGGGSTFAIATLLGARDDPLPELCARQLVEQLSAAGCDLPVMLCLGIKRTSKGRELAAQRHKMQSVVEGCMAHPIWAS